MTKAELLTKIKKGMSITGNYQDDTLSILIDDVKAFLYSAGIETEVLESEAAVGCIMRGVVDLWNYNGGNASFSDVFIMRMLQLKSQKGDTDVQS